MQGRILPLAPALLAAATLAFAADVSVDYDHHADFSQIHTYSWIGVRAGDSLWQDRIMLAVDSQLQAKGWQKTESGGDAAVSAFGRTSERDNMETFYTGFPGWRWRGWGDKKLDEAVSKMFKHFPPPGKD